MKKRVLALFAGLLVMLLGTASAAVTYVLPSGVDAGDVATCRGWQAPDGLESMYALMQNADADKGTTVFRMPNGRALVSLTVHSVPFVQESEWAELWQKAAADMQTRALYVNADPSCQTVETNPWLEGSLLAINTNLVVGDQQTLLNADGYAFAYGSGTAELWAVYPSDPVYLYNEEAASELKADVAALETLLEALRFEPSAATADAGTQTLTLDAFAIQLEVPEGFTVISTDTPQAEREAIISQASDISAGAGAFLQSLLASVDAMGEVYVISPSRTVVMSLYGEITNDHFAMPPAYFQSLDDVLGESLAERYAHVESLKQTEIATLGGEKHGWLTYYMENDEQMGVMLNIFLHSDGTWLRECDLYYLTDHVVDEELNALYGLLVNTLTYTNE